MEYTVVRSNSAVELIKEVNILIKDGWMPQGGLCESVFETERGFYQAMVRALNIESQVEEKTYSVEKIREAHQQAYMPWTDEDDEKLETLFCEGKKTKELSQIFARNEGAISSRIKKLELKEKYKL